MIHGPSSWSTFAFLFYSLDTSEETHWWLNIAVFSSADMLSCLNVSCLSIVGATLWLSLENKCRSIRKKLWRLFSSEHRSSCWSVWLAPRTGVFDIHGCTHFFVFLIIIHRMQQSCSYYSIVVWIIRCHFSCRSFLCVSCAKLGSKFLVRVSYVTYLGWDLGSCVWKLW